MSALQESMLNSELAREDAFGNEASCDGCYNTTNYDVDPTGAVGNARKADRVFMETTDAIGDKNAEITNNLGDDFARKYREKSGPEALIPAYGFILTDMWGSLTPQSGDEVRLSIAMMAAGPELKGASAADDAVEVASTVAKSPAPGWRVVYPRGPGAAVGAVPPNYVNVSRWMSAAEADLWIANGGTKIPRGVGAGGRVYITELGAPKPGGVDPVRVDFAVPAEALNRAGRADWFQVVETSVDVPVQNVVIYYPTP